MAETQDLDKTLIMDRVGEGASANPDNAAPSRVAHYDLKREIGRGALSVVYEAEDTQTGQEVALKLLTLSASLTSLEVEALIARFQREARTAARLSHPNIVHIHEVGAEGKQHFLAMEYLKGQTLRMRMGEGPVPLAEAFAILAQIAEALDAVHKAGIVHRDVKPTNIILLPDGTAKLLDFGIARSSRETAITHRGMIVGSPYYMAPEQIKGETGVKTMDLWALGVLSYEMLAGHLPFTGQNVGSVMFQIMHEPPAPTPDLPPTVQKVLRRALDKRPSQRYSTAGALVQALKLAYPNLAPAAPEHKPAAAPKLAAPPKPVKLPNPVKLPKPAVPFSLPGPRWMPEAALLGLFLLGFGGTYLVRLHTDSHAPTADAGLAVARSANQAPATVSPPASAPAPVLPAPQPSATDTDVPSPPDAASAAAPPAPAPSAPHKAQPESEDLQAALPTAQTPPVTHQAPAAPAVKQEALQIKLKPVAPPASFARTVVSVPVHPHQPVSVTPAPSRPAAVQVASRHLLLPSAGSQPALHSDRFEPAPAPVQPAPAPSAAPPVSVQATDQAATLPAEEGGYDPEADARRRKSAWSQEGTASQP